MTSPIFVGGDPDAGGRDDVAGTVAGAVAAAVDRYTELQSDVITPGSTTIGDLMVLPPVPSYTLPPVSEPGWYPSSGDEPVIS